MSRRVEIQLNPEQGPAQGGIFDRGQRQPAGRGQGRGQGWKQGGGQHHKQPQHRAAGTQPPKRPHSEANTGPLRFLSSSDDQEQTAASLASAQPEAPETKRLRPAPATLFPEEPAAAAPDGSPSTPRPPKQARDLASRLGKFGHILDDSQPLHSPAAAGVVVSKSQEARQSTQATPRTPALPSPSPAAAPPNTAAGATPKSGAGVLPVVKSFEEILMEKRMKKLQGSLAPAPSQDSAPPPPPPPPPPPIPPSQPAVSSATPMEHSDASTTRAGRPAQATPTDSIKPPGEARTTTTAPVKSSPAAPASKPTGAVPAAPTPPSRTSAPPHQSTSNAPLRATNSTSSNAQAPLESEEEEMEDIIALRVDDMPEFAGLLDESVTLHHFLPPPPPPPPPPTTQVKELQTAAGSQLSASVPPASNPVSAAPAPRVDRERSDLSFATREDRHHSERHHSERGGTPPRDRPSVTRGHAAETGYDRAALAARDRATGAEHAQPALNGRNRGPVHDRPAPHERERGALANQNRAAQSARDRASLTARDRAPGPPRSDDAHPPLRGELTHPPRGQAPLSDRSRAPPGAQGQQDGQRDFRERPHGRLRDEAPPDSRRGPQPHHAAANSSPQRPSHSQEHEDAFRSRSLGGARTDSLSPPRNNPLRRARPESRSPSPSDRALKRRPADFPAASARDRSPRRMPAGSERNRSPRHSPDLPTHARADVDIDRIADAVLEEFDDSAMTGQQQQQQQHSSQAPEAEGMLQEAERVAKDGMEDLFTAVLRIHDIPLLVDVLAVLRRRKVFYVSRLIMRIVNTACEQADLGTLSADTRLSLCDALFDLARKPKFVEMQTAERLVSLVVRCELPNLVASASSFLRQEPLNLRFLETCHREALANPVVALELVKLLCVHSKTFKLNEALNEILVFVASTFDRTREMDVRKLYDKLDEAENVPPRFFPVLLKRYIELDLREGSLHIFRCCVRRHVQAVESLSLAELETLHSWARENKQRNRALCEISKCMFQRTDFVVTAEFISAVARALVSFVEQHGFHIPVLDLLDATLQASSQLGLEASADLIKTFLILTKRTRVSEQICELLCKAIRHCLATKVSVSSSDLRAIVGVLLARNRFDTCIEIMEHLAGEDASAVLESILQSAVSVQHWASVDAAVAASLRCHVPLSLEMLEAVCEELDKIDGRLFDKLFAAFVEHPQAKVLLSVAGALFCKRRDLASMEIVFKTFLECPSIVATCVKEAVAYMTAQQDIDAVSLRDVPGMQLVYFMFDAAPDRAANLRVHNQTLAFSLPIIPWQLQRVTRSLPIDEALEIAAASLANPAGARFLAASGVVASLIVAGLEKNLTNRVLELMAHAKPFESRNLISSDARKIIDRLLRAGRGELLCDAATRHGALMSYDDMVKVFDSSLVAHNISQALQILASMRSRKPAAQHCYARALNTCVEKNDLAHAMVVVREMESLKYLVDPHSTLALVRGLLDADGSLEDIQSLVAMWGKARNVRPIFTDAPFHLRTSGTQLADFVVLLRVHRRLLQGHAPQTLIITVEPPIDVNALVAELFRMVPPLQQVRRVNNRIEFAVENVASWLGFTRSYESVSTGSASAHFDDQAQAVSPTSPMPVSVFEPDEDRHASNGAEGADTLPPPPPPFFHEGSAESAVGDPLRHAVLRNNVASSICKHLKVFFQAGRIASKDDFKHCSRKLTHKYLSDEKKLSLSPSSIHDDTLRFVQEFFAHVRKYSSDSTRRKQPK